MSDKLEISYDRQRMSAWISLACVILVLVGLLVLVWSGDSDDKRNISLFFLLVFPGPLLILPIIMLLRSRRKIQLSDTGITYRGCFGSSQITFVDVSRLIWKPSSGGSVRFEGQQSGLAVPFYGLREINAKEVISRIREVIDTDLQYGWNEFLYIVCLGQLSGRKNKQHVASAVSAPGAIVAAISAPLLIGINFVFLRKLVPFPVIACLGVLVILLVMMCLAYILANRKTRVRRLADEFVCENGNRIDFDESWATNQS